MNEVKDFLWVEKYRPKTISDTILPDEVKAMFQQFVDDKNVPNLLLCGRAGVGKTTVAKAMLEEIGADYIVLNGSNEGRKIDTLRYELTNFASTVSFSGGRKYVVIDEADYLNADSVQPALRNFMEQFSSNCGFIFTCNFKNKIIEPLHSRCSVIDFNIPTEVKPKLAGKFYKRILSILDSEGIEYNEKAVAGLIQYYFPDWRRVLNELQRYAGTGRIDEGVLTSKSSDNIDSLISHLKNKKFSEMRKWVAQNVDVDSASLYRQLYDVLPDCASDTTSVAHGIIILAEYQYKEAFVANSEINRVAALATLMAEVNFK